MTPALRVLLLALAACWVTAGGFHAQQPTAEVATSGVQVAVSVRDGDRPVSGLSASDFVLTDNDVEQEVEAVALESVPIDVTLIVDTSGGMSGAAGRLAQDAQQVARLVHRDDALRLIRIDSFAVELRAMTPPATATAMDGIPRQSGFGAVHDALIAALVRRVAPDRPHLVVAMTEGHDTISINTADRVREVAAQSEAVLQIVMVRPPASYRSPQSFLRPRYNDQNTLILTEAAESTGGALRSRRVGDADLVAAFKRAFDEFRQSYLLRYAPRGLESAGWHELSVTVPKTPNATVHARKGYYGS